MLSPAGRTAVVLASLLAAASVVAVLGWLAVRGPREKPSDLTPAQAVDGRTGARIPEADRSSDDARPAARSLVGDARPASPGQYHRRDRAAAPRGTAGAPARAVVRPAPPCRVERLALGPDSVVIEAEAFQFMTYGWEVGEAPGASGGRYIHMKEGVGDFESEDRIRADPTVRSGDFYNVTRDRRPIEARCYFLAPRAGRYFVAARTMAHGDHCSNITYVKIGDVRHQVGDNGTRPFVWLWHDVAEVRLRKGLNRLSLMAHQDDVKVDQVVLTPLSGPGAGGRDVRAISLVRRGRVVRAISSTRPGRAFSGGCRETPALPAGIPPVNLSLSARTLAVTGGGDPGISAYVHKNVPGTVEARARFALELPPPLEGAGTVEVLEDACDVRLTDGEELVRIAWRPALPGDLARREYLARCRLSATLSANGAGGEGELVGEPVEERTLVLFRGYDWSVLGPLPYMETPEAAEPERDPRPASEYTFGGRTYGWMAYDERCTDHFGTMDFGRMLADAAPRKLSRATLYAYTEVRAREAGRYLLKAQGDDNLVVWVNGGKAVTIVEKGPPIRTAREVRIRLRAGRNRLLLRLNQREGQWQAAIRIRTLDDRPAEVEGTPFPGQDVGFAR